MENKMLTFNTNLPSLPQELMDKAIMGLSTFDSIPLFTQLLSHGYEQWIKEQAKSVVNHYQTHFKKGMIILGTGGSNLGSKALYQLCENPVIPLYFYDNIDPHTFNQLTKQFDLSQMGVMAISKSGRTPETLMQLLYLMKIWEQQRLDISKHFGILTEPVQNPLRFMAQDLGIKNILDHPTDIGGRFSIFTLVGLFPALVAGLDISAFLKGAQTTLQESQARQEACQGAAFQYSLLNKGIHQSVILPYVDRLRTFSLWYRQLWAESLGKQGKGTTPIDALGTVDQHSQFQLYLDGPKDKFFTILTTDPLDNPTMMLDNIHETWDDLSIFAHRSMGQLMAAEQQAAIDTLRNNECPVRHIHIPDLSLEALGQLCMHYVLETLAMSALLDVNPFDQPAVEEGKILTKKYFSEMESGTVKDRTLLMKNEIGYVHHE